MWTVIALQNNAVEGPARTARGTVHRYDGQSDHSPDNVKLPDDFPTFP